MNIISCLNYTSPDDASTMCNIDTTTPLIKQQYKTWIIALISLCYETVSSPMMFLLTDISDPSAVTAALAILMILGSLLAGSSLQCIQ